MGCNKMTTLKKLILYPTHGDLARRLSPNRGPENYKVKHTPQVQSYEQLNRMNRMEVWHFRADFHTKIELQRDHFHSFIYNFEVLSQFHYLLKDANGKIFSPRCIAAQIMSFTGN